MRVTNNSDAQLMSALNDLERDWAITAETWRDKARADFEKAYVEELSTTVRRAVNDIGEIKQLLRKAVRDCS